MNDWPQEWELRVRLFQDHGAKMFFMVYEATHTQTRRKVDVRYTLDVPPEGAIEYLKQEVVQVGRTLTKRKDQP